MTENTQHMLCVMEQSKGGWNPLQILEERAPLSPLTPPLMIRKPKSFKVIGEVSFLFDKPSACSSRPQTPITVSDFTSLFPNKKSLSLAESFPLIGEGDGTPLQFSCLENPMEGGTWWAVVHGVAKSRTRLSDFTFTFMHWRRKWQPTPVFLPGESQGRWSLVGCRLWGRTESDTTEVT